MLKSDWLTWKSLLETFRLNLHSQLCSFHFHTFNSTLFLIQSRISDSSVFLSFSLVTGIFTHQKNKYFDCVLVEIILSSLCSLQNTCSFRFLMTTSIFFCPWFYFLFNIQLSHTVLLVTHIFDTLMLGNCCKTC